MDFGFENMAPPGGSGDGRQIVDPWPLARCSSVYSLTFDELQNGIGGIGARKDFGSMNLDEFLKSVWTAEEALARSSAFGSLEGGISDGANLQRLYSLNLPRTLSQKTVDEVWKDMSRGNAGREQIELNFQQKQQTLGEVTLEEFLVKAGVVREDSQSTVQRHNGGFCGEEASGSHGHREMDFSFPQLDHATRVGINRIPENNSQTSQRSLKPEIQTHKPLVSSMKPRVNVESANEGMSSIMGVDPHKASNYFEYGSRVALQSRVGTSVAVIGSAGVPVPIGTPGNRLSTDGLGKRNHVPSSSPIPYVFNGDRIRERKRGTIEKVVERRQRRMIKNRESAARSRARKQAHTLELEAEVEKLKEENKELHKKQEEILEVLKHQFLNIISQRHAPSLRWLRRTQTGPW